ncbi:carbohydrate-binding domain-containing protein [Shewanella sp. A32]|uniref:carbohydrate-binding domain-containing protein n=1 Tax=Shewanella sp. A32 TaxID=3031327 RepID=UPI0023B92048|nr:carbohydrate-binding domain-containing protein [Shewanella sp. A32]MDF0532916.1 carbohydrate-binding domain-containing protein [Shewanella sp. A32]
MKKLPNILVVISLIGFSILLGGCGGNDDATVVSSDSSQTSDASDNGSNTTDTADSSTIVTESWNLTTGQNAADDSSELNFNTINIYLSTDGISAESESNELVIGTASDGVIPVTYDGTTIISIVAGSDGLTVNATNDDEMLINYALYGSYEKTVTFYSNSEFKLTLAGVEIDSSDGPAINIQSDERAFVSLLEDTTNILTDSSTWSDRTLPDGSDMDLKATFFSEGPLIFNGTGQLDITATKKHAICSDKHVRIASGTIEITSENKDGIRTNNAFVMDGGVLNIVTEDGAGKGIKVEGKENDNGGYGFIVINDGTINIESYDKAITAAWKVAEDSETTTTDDDPDPRVTINGGDITIVTTGTPFETADDSLSPEGIEAKSTLTINGGNLSVQTTDDALNAGNALVINDGYIYASASQNDAIDSNGTLTVTGGVVVADGAGGADGGLDCDNNTFKITGGLIVGIGGRNSSVTRSVTTQNTVALSNINSGNLVVTDASGNAVFAYQMPNSASAVLISSPALATGSSYTVYRGGTLRSYDELFNGMYVDPANYTAGSVVTSFTISSTVTSAN